MSQYKCLNCGAAIFHSQNFCTSCGQRTNVHRLNFHELTHDLIHAVTHADKSIFTLVRDLVVKPGVVAREYLSGKRKKYFPPISFFLIVAGLVVFMTSYFYKPDTSRSRQLASVAEKIKDPVKKQEMLQMSYRIKNVSLITGKYSNVINMIATPFLTLLFWLFFRRSFNYTESLVANMYFVAFIMIAYSLLIVPLQNIFPKYSVYFLGAFFIFEIVYRGFAYYQLLNKKGAMAVLKAYGISLMVTILWVAITYSLIVTYIRTGF